jgi:hypothetical protein
MRFSNRMAALTLLAVGGSLAVANVMVTGLRTTIPRSLDAVVAERVVLHEKHPGLDDACLLALDDGRTLQVDPVIYDTVAPRDRLQKAAWEHTLQIDDRTLPLDWSADARGMVCLMPLVVVVMLAQAWWAATTRRQP